MIIKRRPGSRPPREMVKATQVGMFIQAPGSVFPRARETLPSSEEGLGILRGSGKACRRPLVDPLGSALMEKVKIGGCSQTALAFLQCGKKMF